MRKIVAIITMLIVVCVIFVGCDTAKESSNNEIKDTGIIEEVIESVSITSYEDILNDYSQTLRDATPILIEEYKEAAKSNQDGLSGLAKLSNEKVSELAKISNDGMQEMAKLYYKQGSGVYEEYSEWAGKLQEVYMEEAMKIQNAYMDSAL